MYYKPNPELCKNNNTFESNTCCTKRAGCIKAPSPLITNISYCYACSFNTACAAARRATGTLYGEQLT